MTCFARPTSWLFGSVLALCSLAAGDDRLDWIVVSPDRAGFRAEPGGARFVPWGFNYDHDHRGRLLEDYWLDEWPSVAGDFAEMKQLGANCVRVHLQLARFLESPTVPRAASLAQLRRLVALAERSGLYLNLTGLGCYHKPDVPAWYDRLSESRRWAAQACFWRAVAETCAASPAVFCYDLMNEPVVAAEARTDGNWLGPPFAGKHFVQYVSLDPQGRTRPQVARQWIARLVEAIRQVDRRHLITVGLVEWSLDRPGLTSGFVPNQVAGQLDFVSVHLYPAAGKVEEALRTLAGFRIGKPVVIEETFPLACSREEFAAFLDGSRRDAAGWFSFYWGRPPEKLRASGELADALLLQALETFQQRGKDRAR